MFLTYVVLTINLKLEKRQYIYINTITNIITFTINPFALSTNIVFVILFMIFLNIFANISSADDNDIVKIINKGIEIITPFTMPLYLLFLKFKGSFPLNTFLIILIFELPKIPIVVLGIMFLSNSIYLTLYLKNYQI